MIPVGDRTHQAEELDKDNAGDMQKIGEFRDRRRSGRPVTVTQSLTSQMEAHTRREEVTSGTNADSLMRCKDTEMMVTEAVMAEATMAEEKNARDKQETDG